jgi:tetratricopeptide (TPR) repeat protein
MKAADEVVHNVTPMLADMAMLEPFGAKKLYVLLRFNRWNDVLQLPAPAASQLLLTALYHFGRGVAQAGLGNTTAAREERAAYAAATKAVPPDTAWLYNSATGIFAVADAVLDARIAAASGDEAGAIAAWEKAVAAEDRLNYDEPADWFYPTRESLGAALLRAKRWDDARRVFREDLEKNIDNPRSLFGLWSVAIAADPRDASALGINRRFNDAWKSETPLTLADY